MSSFILTIDDGPSMYMKQKLDFLNQYDIKATWFCLGENIEPRKEVLISAIKTGHTIGNHSFTHPRFSEIDMQTAKDEILRTDKLINQIYKEAGVSQDKKIFRFPYGDQGDCINRVQSNGNVKKLFRQELKDFLVSLNYVGRDFTNIEYSWDYIQNKEDDPYWGWSYDIEEWAIRTGRTYTKTLDEVIANLNEYLTKYNTLKDQIILIHDHDETTEFFPKLIKIFLDHGIKFIPS